MDIDNIRKKELIQYYQSKRLFLFLDEWGFYLLLVGMHYFGFSFFLILPIMIYGSIGLYTSYKNLDKIENKIIPLQQDIYAYQDLYALLKLASDQWKIHGFQINIPNRVVSTSGPVPVPLPVSIEKIESSATVPASCPVVPPLVPTSDNLISTSQ